jgi:hypothetical protein
MEQYRKNPILLWNHNRPWRGTTDEILPIGRMENLRIEGDKLIGTPVFDENDKFAQKIKSKYESNIIRMSSIGFDVMETSEDPSLIVSGQRRSTVTKAKLIEVSLTDIGANDDALVLYKDGNMISLSAGGENQVVPILTQLNNENNNESNYEMKVIALKLGLPETATEAEILNKIVELQTTANQASKLQKQIDEQVAKAIEQSVEAAIKSKKVTAEKKAHFLSLGKTSGLEVLNATLEMIEPAVKPSGIINKTGGTGTTEYKKLSDVPAEERIEMRKSDPETYKKLYKEEYGIELKIEN